ncbi:sigma-54-dependent transcriptional regulator [Roseibacillus ishigakijimensis]|uniref:Sigma-54-dependent Fis family transcriptional regulator n=1 Tax=Roseibacillus ishigakijimensis TaxID=454146 RepID=A0A934RPG4_9BACT|nr:sigma-54 dependent transcriptional regulator [Roseibacillus ishigakijimensis]MBK1835597.1 sigma-54-dependent Fis family transcriptional regulator [Roseibacillus ishigakijimensis]
MEPILLIVDDEKPTRDGLRMALDESFDVYVAADLAQAREVLKNENVDLLLTDLRLGAESGMDLIEEALALPKPPVAIMMTAYGSVDTAVEAMRRGAFHFVTKPLNIDEVENLLLRAARSRKLEKQNTELRNENATLRQKTAQAPSGLDRILGKSEAIRRVTEMVEQVAATKATVLIEGESGTGKELVAHALHDLSGRPADKFVIVNCAALSPQLLESELFGHEKGAFTGATQRRVGRFEQAHGGTLVLDEIGEIDPATQVKLLRALSERAIERVGSNTPVEVDVRLVAATNKSLRHLVESGEFREDLFFRLNVLKIDMPPLRERPEDVVLLANAFLKEFSDENARPLKPLADDALALIRSYRWPGNVRELRTAMEHGVILSNSDQIEARHLPGFMTGREITPAAKGAGTGGKETEKNLAPMAELNLHALEADAIERALRQTDGNKTKAASLLGISRRTLQRKLNERADDPTTLD